MRILSVYPIAKGFSREKLSYFSPADIPLGSVVSVPLRKKMVAAVVVSSANAEDQKADLKSSDYALRKIGRGEPTALFSPAFIKAAVDAADYFAASPGGALSSLIPKAVLDNIKKLEAPRPGSPVSARKASLERFVLQAGDEERYSNYKSLIREEFARKRSVFFLLPTIEDIRKVRSTLEKGIEEYAIVLHGKLKPKKIVESWNLAARSDHPVLIIATGQFLSLCRSDLKTVIVENEASRNYKTISRPYLDLRVVAEKFAENSGARLVLGDALLRTETLWRVQNDEFLELAPLKFRALTTANVALVDMRTEADAEKKRFRVFSDELESAVRANKEESGLMFLFGARKGYASTTVCHDCGEIVRCTNCNAPVTLYRKGVEINYFFCGKCGETRDAKERCAHCESWNLTMLGVGVERIAEVMAERFPEVKVFRLDKDSVSTQLQAEDTVEKFKNSPGSVLIGTELALIYLDQGIGNSAIVSIDSLFAVPDFRVSERLFHILIQMRNLSDKRFIIQTRNAGEKIFSYAAQGNLTDFYRDEIEARKQFQYPPFSIFIKISLEGPRVGVEKEMRKLQEFLLPFQADLVPSFDAPNLKKFEMHALLKIKAADWPNKELLEKLRALPPAYRIKVDPDTLI